MYQNQLLAARILDATLSGHNLTDVMSSEAAHITGDRRAQLLDLTHGSLRRYGRLRVKLDHLLERPLTDPVVVARGRARDPTTRPSDAGLLRVWSDAGLLRVW